MAARRRRRRHLNIEQAAVSGFDAADGGLSPLKIEECFLLARAGTGPFYPGDVAALAQADTLTSTPLVRRHFEYA